MAQAQTPQGILKMLDEFLKAIEEGGEIPPFEIYDVDVWMDEEEFNKLLLRIREDGFILINGAEDRRVSFENYKEYRIVREYEHINDEKIKIYFEFYRIDWPYKSEYEILQIGFGLEPETEENT